MITQAQLIAKYGTPNKTGKGYLVWIDLPYPMYLNWQTKTYVKRIQCHKLVADSLKNIFTDILAHYGIYDTIPMAEWHKPFRCLSCKERFESDTLIRKKYPYGT